MIGAVDRELRSVELERFSKSDQNVPPPLIQKTAGPMKLKFGAMVVVDGATWGFNVEHDRSGGSRATIRRNMVDSLCFNTGRNFEAEKVIFPQKQQVFCIKRTPYKSGTPNRTLYSVFRFGRWNRRNRENKFRSKSSGNQQQMASGAWHFVFNSPVSCSETYLKIVNFLLLVSQI